ncbi:MAG: metal ABC transporter permease [Planctomycetales bacterium]|nr:metal ABC transporter permease [Planctomycetales bacterium]
MISRRCTAALTVACCALLVCSTLHAQPSPVSPRSIDKRTESTSWNQSLRVIFLRDYNTRVVVFGTTLLGCAGGMVGSFTLLRKRALMGDALSHATLPGIVLAFIIATRFGLDGKSLPFLLSGATVSGLLGVGVILLIRQRTRLKEDTALGAVLSVFFGGGLALLSVSQQMQQGHVAGLESFIYGKTASMGAHDIRLIMLAAIVCIGICLLLFKEFKLLCFDEEFAASRGFPVMRLDIVLMALVVTICIVGLQAVGIVLVIALLIIPAAAARFWTDQLSSMFAISGGLGALGGMVGAEISALFSRLPSGAMIVLVYTLLFSASMLLGRRRGVLIRGLRRLRLNRQIDRQHLLRAIYELRELTISATRNKFEPTRNQGFDVDRMQLLAKRSWSAGRLGTAIRRAVRDGLVRVDGDDISLTDEGMVEAARLTRQHRLWELYLITYAEIAPSRVDRDADAIEHVLEPELISELEGLLARRYTDVPASPHDLGTASILPSLRPPGTEA